MKNENSICHSEGAQRPKNLVVFAALGVGKTFEVKWNEILPLHSVQGQNDIISMYSIFKAMTPGYSKRAFSGLVVLPRSGSVKMITIREMARPPTMVR